MPREKYFIMKYNLKNEFYEFFIMLLLIRGSSKEQVSPFKIIIFDTLILFEAILFEASGPVMA